jgi:hypothetical protein
MDMATKLPKAERSAIIRDLKSKNLFPLKYVSRYTPAFRKEQKSLSKKFIKTLCDFSYTRLGCLLLCAIVDMKSLLKRIGH